LVYLGLAAVAASLVIGHSSGSGSQSQETDLAGRALRLPAGRWIVAAVGVGIVIGGVVSFFKAVTGKWADSIERQPARGWPRNIVATVAATGMIARSVIFVLVGVFVVRAAWRYDPGQATGVDGALKRLAGASHGPLLLILVAIGLLAYGVWCELMAYYGPRPGT
jgi:hypothetical protein